MAREGIIELERIDKLESGKKVDTIEYKVGREGPLLMQLSFDLYTHPLIYYLPPTIGHVAVWQETMNFNYWK